jgi:Major Facilitator Superfamily
MGLGISQASVAGDEVARVRARDVLIERRWTIAALLFLSGLINCLDRTIISVALPVISVDLHLGPAKMGVLLSAFFWSYPLMQVPIGWLSDRFNIPWLRRISNCKPACRCHCGLPVGMGAEKAERACGREAVQGHPEHFGPLPVPGQNPMRFSLARVPLFRAFSSNASSRRPFIRETKGRMWNTANKDQRSSNFRGWPPRTFHQPFINNQRAS